MAHSFYFGGTEADPTGSAQVYLGGPSYGITIPIEEVDWLISSVIDVADSAYGYGGASWGTHHPGKLFRLPFILKGDSWQDTRNKLDALNLVLDKNRLAALRFEDFPDRYWLARFSGRDPVRIFQRGATGLLEFTAPDPRAYALTETTQTVNITSGDNNFTVPASGSVAGTAEADVTFLIKPTSSGATSPVILENATRDETLTWNNALTSSEWLRITASARVEKAEKTGDSGSTYSTVNSSVSAGSRFPKLSPNVSNAFTFSGSAGNGTIEITYRARFN